MVAVSNFASIRGHELQRRPSYHAGSTGIWGISVTRQGLSEYERVGPSILACHTELGSTAALRGSVLFPDYLQWIEDSGELY